MRVLWITNIVFPAIAEKLNLPKVVVGGWMYSSAKKLMEVDSDVKLAVATVYSGKCFIEHELDGIQYYLLPLNGANNDRKNKALEKYWRKVNESFVPDCVHLHGTECAHGLSFLKACPTVPTVASIQGLISRCARYYLAGLSFWDIFNSLTLRDIVRGTVWAGKRSFMRRGKTEIEIIRGLKHIIGRTSWDKSHALAINPDINYHFCNETLRESFYGKMWNYEECDKHSIFVSQASYPLKGLHQLLKAMPLILRQYPDAKIYVAGSDVTNADTIKRKLLMTGYGRYLGQLINKYHLTGKVVFTGNLSEEEMCKRYLQSNVFVCPSSIENSPNSLGEAQLLGVPCIASYVGGSMDMMAGCESNLYRFEEIEMLAAKVCNVFAQCRTANAALQAQAAKRHDGTINGMALSSIYRNLMK